MAMTETIREETRDFSIGRVFARAAGTVGRNPLVTLSMALLLGAVPALIISLLTRGVFATDVEGATTDMSIGLFITGILTWMVMMAIGVIVQAGLTRATLADSEGRKASFGECVMAGVQVILPLVALILLWTGGIALGMIVFLIPGIILMLMWAVAIPSLVVERQGIFAAFARSRELTKGSRWKILGVLVLLLVAYMLLTIVLGIAGVSTLETANIGSETAGALSIAAIVSSLIPSTLFNLAWGTIQPAMYVELRDAKEGGSVEHLQEVFA